MPRIDQNLLGSTIYLYESRDAAAQGKALGGSGVLVGVEKHPEDPAGGSVTLYFVTCDHVANLGAPVARVVTRSDREEIEAPGRWVPHPDGAPDVVVARFKAIPYGGGESLYSYIPFSKFATLADLTYKPGVPNGTPDQPYYFGNLIGAGDDTALIGRFLAEDGVLSQTPTVRFGNLASPGPAEVVFDDQRRPSRQECLLVESRSLPGYSGSAVYVFHPNSTYGGLNAPIEQADLHLWRFLGIDCAHMNQRVDEQGRLWGWEPAMAIPGRPRLATTNSGMMTVVPAWEIARTIERVIAEAPGPNSLAELD